MGEATLAHPPFGEANLAHPPFGKANLASPPFGDANLASPPLIGDANLASPPFPKRIGVYKLTPTPKLSYLNTVHQILNEESPSYDVILKSNSTDIQKSNSSADHFLGSILIVCMLIGIPSNLLSSYYFMNRVKKSVHDALYLVASISDFCILISAAVPVTVLIGSNDRSPVVFSYSGICESWTFFFLFATRFSIFVVMVISTMRAVSIHAPHRVISRTTVACSCLVYAAWLIGKDSLFYAFNVTRPTFNKPYASCIYGYKGTAGHIFVFFLGLELLAVLLIIMINFVISITSLPKKSKIKSKSAGKLKAVSTTITTFTFVCLTCNLPLFLTMIIDLTSTFPSLHITTRFYLRLVSYLVLTVLNAALNPCIYLTRMPVYKKWAYQRSSSFRSLFTSSNTHTTESTKAAVSGVASNKAAGSGVTNNNKDVSSEGIYTKAAAV